MTSRQQRRREKSNKPTSASKNNWLLWGGVVVVVVAVTAVAIVGLFPTSSGTADESVLVTGGSLIGDPNAPVTLVEFGDFQ